MSRTTMANAVRQAILRERQAIQEGRRIEFVRWVDSASINGGSMGRAGRDQPGRSDR
jgi:hypothetical protein